MAIDKSGQWWTSADAADIEPYLQALTEESYQVDAYRAVRCDCGCDRFGVQRTGDVTRRECATCKQVRYICRDAADWEEARQDERVETYKCVECTCRQANLGIGFARYSDPGTDGIKWFHVGVRCASCGILGGFNDGKIGFGPADEVFGSI